MNVSEIKKRTNIVNLDKRLQVADATTDTFGMASTKPSTVSTKGVISNLKNLKQIRRSQFNPVRNQRKIGSPTNFQVRIITVILISLVNSRTLKL